MKVEKRDIATFDEKCKAIKTALTPEFYSVLVKYSIKRLHLTFNIKYDLEKGFRGIMVEDLISNTFEALLNKNGRNWYKDKFPDIKQQIISSLDSVIYNYISSELEKVNNTFEIYENENIEIVENYEYEQILSSCIDVLEKLGCSDDELLLFEPYIIHEMKRKDLADLFGIPLNVITNLKKKLDRKLPVLRIKINELGYKK